MPPIYTLCMPTDLIPYHTVVLTAAALILTATTLSYGDVYHTPHTIPWFFERTVHIESDGRVSAGIIWDSYTIITTGHGIYNSTELVVTNVHGDVIPTVLVHTDPYSDVAILTAYTGMPPLIMSNAGPGEQVYAVGHPGGRPYAITGGIISSVSRGAPASVQHDAATYTGSSGGPLFDDTGALVGMSAAIDNLSFAIPRHIIETVIESVRMTGTYTPGCIGIMLDGNTVRSVRERVTGIIHPGDVVLSVDGGMPYNLLYGHPPGDIIPITLEDRNILVRLGGMTEWFGVHMCRDQ